MYDCGNFTNRRREVEREGEICYWLPDISFDTSDGTFACSFDPPSFGVKTDIKERSSKKRRRTEAIPTLKAIHPLSWLLDDPFKDADVYDDQRTKPFFNAAASQTNYDYHQFDLTGTDEEFSDISNEDSVTYSFDFFAGERSSAALYTIRGAKLDPLPRLEPGLMIEMLQSNHLKTNDLAIYFYNLERSTGQYTPCIKSLTGIDLVSKIYQDIPGATIAMSVMYQPLCDSRWLLTKREHEWLDIGELLAGKSAEKIKYHMDSYAAKFACIAMMELGGWNIDPEGLHAVMAMSTGNSIFVASQLLQDPAEKDTKFEIKRIVGNIGRAGIAMLVPPENCLIRPMSECWKLIMHKEYDGKVEDCFNTTTLHLSFTGHELPLTTKSSGTVDSNVNLVEALVSVHDRGNWVADIDVLRSLNSSNLHRFEHQQQCEHDQNVTTSRVTQRNRTITSIDSWDELFDQPVDLGKGNLGVIRAYRNWSSRSAAACISMQKGYRTAILSEEPLCQRCLDHQFRSPHICIF